MTEPLPVVPRPSATVLLVRDDPDLRVLMVQRHGGGDFADAMVFPGGLVDARDADPAWRTLVVDYDQIEPHERPFRIAAYRELFEETGLLSAPRSAEPVADAEAGPDPFADHLLVSGHRLTLAALHPFAHWITPVAATRRFDTRFYICADDALGEAVFDGMETLGGQWIAPAQAIELGRSGERKIVFPTRMNLELLARSRTVADAIAHARARPVATVTPWRERRADGNYMRISPDAGYAISELPVGPHDALPTA